MERDLTDNLPRMYRVALRILGDPQKADEAVQNACVQALQSASQFGDRSSRTTWLYRIAVNCSIDLSRRNGRDRSRPLNAEETAGVLHDVTGNPELAVEQKELYAIACGLIDDLPDDCRGAFVLTQLDGYSYDEAAEIEGVARGTVASRVYRARKLLSRALAEKTADARRNDR